MTTMMMKLSVVVLSAVALIASSSVFVDAQYRRPTSYRRRHLTPYDAVCLGTAAPTTRVIPAPVPGPVPQPTPKGPTGGGGKGPTSKTGPVPCPPSGSKSGGPSPSKSGPSPSKSGPSPSKSGSGYSKSGPPPGRSGPSPSKSGPSPSKSGPSPSKSGPSPSKSGSSYSKSGPSPSKSGPSPGRSGPSPSKSGPAPGCRRFLQMAASTLGFSVRNNKQPVTEIEDSLSQATPLSATKSIATTTSSSTSMTQRSLQQIITLNTTFLAFGSYTLPSSFSGFAFLSWPDDCFTATIEVTNFIPNCLGCSFVVTDGAHTCVASSIPAVVPFVDPTEVDFNPYTNSTFFDTDASGNAVVTVSDICTGTGPEDNFERPLLLLDPNGVIAACGRLFYQCE